MAKIDMGQVNVQVKKGIKNSFKGIAFSAARTKVVAAKQELLKEFDNHHVTKELQSPSEGQSQVVGRGTLYGFLGFEEDPTPQVREQLESISIENDPTISEGKTQVTFSFPVEGPLEADLEDAAPLPYSGKSWVRVVEKGGLNNFNRFLHWVTEGSRSGFGIQSKKPTSLDGGFRPTSYVLTLLKNFYKRISKR